MSKNQLSRRAFAIAGSLACLGLQTGCTAAVRSFAGDPPTLYNLSPKSTYDDDLPTVEWQLLVETPVAAAGLNSPRIAIRQSPFELDYYAQVGWITRAPEMIQTLIVASFENTDRIIGVGRDVVGLRGNYVLATDLRHFQAETIEGPNPQIRIRLSARLVRMPQRLIVAGENFEALFQSPSNRFDDIIETFDEALGHVIKRLVQWTLRMGQDDYVRRS